MVVVVVVVVVVVISVFNVVISVLKPESRDEDIRVEVEALSPDEDQRSDRKFAKSIFSCCYMQSNIFNVKIFAHFSAGETESSFENVFGGIVLSQNVSKRSECAENL